MQTLADIFMQDFGFSQTEVKVAAVDVGVREWRFSLSSISDHASQVWITTHATIFAPTSAAESVAAEIANNLELSATGIALATRAVNGVPLVHFIHQIDPVNSPFTAAELDRAAKAINPLFPEEELHKKAAFAMLKLLRKMRRDVIDALSIRHDAMFQPSALISSVRFKCTSGECAYITDIPVADLQRVCNAEMVAPSAKMGTIHCPRCGTTAVPPEGSTKEDPNSPLGRRFGKG